MRSSEAVKENGNEKNGIKIALLFERSKRAREG
jgi:hypothetical protein